MTITTDATNAELRTATEVLKLASLLDDRVTRADPNRIVAWAEMIHRHGLELDDLLASCQEYYARPSDRAITIGDLIARACAIRRDRTEREDDDARERRQERQNTKAADDTATLTAAFASGAAQPTSRLVAADKALRRCTTRGEARQAIGEHLAAKAEAKNRAAA
jgi:hypothetical protein